MYRIYTDINYADTTRDPDKVVITELCYKKTKKSAIRFCKEFISKNFCKNNAELEEIEDGFIAIDFCSYGKTLRVKKIIFED